AVALGAAFWAGELGRVTHASLLRRRQKRPQGPHVSTARWARSCSARTADDGACTRSHRTRPASGFDYRPHETPRTLGRRDVPGRWRTALRTPPALPPSGAARRSGRA